MFVACVVKSTLSLVFSSSRWLLIVSSQHNVEFHLGIYPIIFMLTEYCLFNTSKHVHEKC